VFPPYFYFRFSRNRSFFNDFRAIPLRISAQEGGNTVCWKAMARQRTVDNSMTYWFPWKHLMARRRGLEFGVFYQTPRNGLVGSALLASILFLRQNYHNQRIGSAIRTSPFVSFGAFARKYYPNVDSALRASLFERSKCSSPQFFAVSMSASRSRTCCARLRPRRVSSQVTKCVDTHLFSVRMYTYEHVS